MRQRHLLERPGILHDSAHNANVLRKDSLPEIVCFFKGYPDAEFLF